MRYIAPAGMPLGLMELATGLSAGTASKSLRHLEARLAGLTDTAVCRSFSSGRAAMTVALKAMKRASRDARRTEVVIPAYTCYSVPAAVHRAGLQVRLCDLDPTTLDLDLASLDRSDLSRVLAIVSTSIFGIPNSLEELEQIARTRGVYLVDDAAQALGAQHAGRPVASFGDAGILSFEKGKNITTMNGGALVTRNSDLASCIDLDYETLPPAPVLAAAMTCTKLLLYAICSHPLPYSFVRRIPGLGLGLSVYDTTYSVGRYSRLLAGLATRLCERLDAINLQRNRNAASIEHALLDVSGVRLLTRHASSRPAHVRLPIFIDARERRMAVLAALDHAGIGASASYPHALGDVPEVRAKLMRPDAPMPGARQIASSIVTLPTHPFCPPDIGTRIAEIVRRTLRVSQAD